jgi:dTDP-4-amino-4,6-dideoxygalactose transaminase
MINFHEIYYTGKEIEYINEAMDQKTLHGNGYFTSKVSKALESRLGGKSMLLPSCTSALEMIALLLNINSKDEIIMPSYTFVSTANAFALRGAEIKFVDVEPLTMNVSIESIKNTITERTKAVVVVNYGGFSVAFDELLSLLKDQEIYLIEDNAQGIGASYNHKPLGSFGDFSCLSFHDTKNITSGGEGGALIINNDQFIEAAHIIQEKGTNRHDFMNKKVNFYSWQQLGSSFLMSEINAAFLYAQLEALDEINAYRKELWELYYKGLENLECNNYLYRQKKCNKNVNNGHLFFIKLKLPETLKELKAYLKENKIQANTHYVPLHSSKAGKLYGEFIGDDHYTTKGSKTLLRLPLHNHLEVNDVNRIINTIQKFFKERYNE